MRENKEKIRQHKWDSLNPILKEGYFLFSRRDYDKSFSYEIHYFENDNNLRDYLVTRFASKPGRRLHEYYIEKLINGDEVRAKLDDNGDICDYTLQVFHDENIIQMFRSLRIFGISARREMNDVRSAEEMQSLVNGYNEIFKDPPKFKTIYDD